MSEKNDFIAMYGSKKMVDNPNVDHEAVLSSPHHDKDTIDAMAKHFSNKNRYSELVATSSPHEEHHDQLVTHESDRVRRGLAENRFIGAKHIEKLANDQDKYVRRAIASNPAVMEHKRILSDEHLNQLAKHHDSYIAGVANRTIRQKQELYNTLKRL